MQRHVGGKMANKCDGYDEHMETNTGITRWCKVILCPPGLFFCFYVVYAVVLL